MIRKSFTRKERARLFELRKRCCYLCSGKNSVGEAWEIEHVIPWEISRDDSDGNLELAHKKCHRVKTDADMKDIAKVRRVAAKHNGTFVRSKVKIQSRAFPKRT